MILGLRRLGDDLVKHFYDIQATWKFSGRNLMPLVISRWIILHIIKFDLALGLIFPLEGGLMHLNEEEN
jgi:hypothetical protein